jgi:hypothetical protein
LRDMVQKGKGAAGRGAMSGKAANTAGSRTTRGSTVSTAVVAAGTGGTSGTITSLLMSMTRHFYFIFLKIK